MKPIALLCSDTHNRPKREDEKHAFRQIIDRAVDLRVHVIGAGDLIDRQSNRSETITFLYQQLARLKAVGRRFYYTQGQHDYDDPPWLSAHPSAIHLHKETLDLTDDIVLYGLDWQPFGKLQEELAEIPSSANFLVCHQVWGNWMGDVASPQGSFEQIPGHIKYVHTGDLHQWKLETRKNADGEDMRVLSCGATTQQKIDEPSTHHYALLYPDGKIEKKTLTSRVMLESSLLLKQEDVEQFITELEPTLEVAMQKAASMSLPESMCTPYFRVRYSSKLSDVVRRTEKAVGSRAVMYFSPQVSEEKLESYAKAKKVKQSGAVTPLSVLGEEVDKEESPATFELVQRMLSVSDQEIEFAKWRGEFLGETS